MDISPAPTNLRSRPSRSNSRSTTLALPPPPPRLGAAAALKAPGLEHRPHSGPASINPPAPQYPFLKNLFASSSSSSSSAPPSVLPTRSSSPETFLVVPADSGASSIPSDIRAPSPSPSLFAPSSLSSNNSGGPASFLSTRPQFSSHGSSSAVSSNFNFSRRGSASSLRSNETCATSVDGGVSSAILLEEEQFSSSASSSLKPTAPLQLSAGRSRAPIPPAWNSRHTAPAGGLLAPPIIAPVKRLRRELIATILPKSEPIVPTCKLSVADNGDSSPVRMDVDGSSPFRSSVYDGQGPDSSPFTSLRPANHPRSVSDTRVPPSHHQHQPSSSPSTGSGSSTASERFKDLFSHDLSPIPNTRKRLLELEHSPTPGSSSINGGPGASSLDSLVLGPGSTAASNLSSITGTTSLSRRTFEKAVSTSNLVPRRRASQQTLRTSRPPLAAVQSSNGGVLTSAADNGSSTFSSSSDHQQSDSKRHAQQFYGKPWTMKGVRRAYSVADATVEDLAPALGNVVVGGAGGDKRSRGAQGTSASIDIGTAQLMGAGGAGHGIVGNFPPKPKAPRAPTTGSPLTGFRSQEEKGKALPCFGVKEDGLMRINAATLNRLQSGEFADKVSRYLIIDCRFSYEFEGGHIAEAVNLPTTNDVEHHLLHSDVPPTPSTSECAGGEGKTVLIFHCEFSAKRAPTSACHLRSKDRLKNQGVYPKIHYPEVYVLQGGYANYYKAFPSRCSGGYRQMDDPEHIAMRSQDLNSFRHQQKRPFSRASSFTFGEARSTAAILAASQHAPPVKSRKAAFVDRGAGGGGGGGLAPTGFVFPATGKASASSSSMITEEEHESGDSSFGTNPGSSPCAGGGDSPCPSSKVGRHSLKIGKEVGGRRGLDRAQTSSILMFTR
ncbi:hypothetical protein T439DRAFT_331258 [Meredithblackwellia eburnea MCA 4105]